MLHSSKSVDLVMVAGAGPAGLRATYALQQLGVSVVLVDPHAVGGTLNLDYDYTNSRTGVRESSLDLKSRLLLPWKSKPLPIAHEKVLRAQWSSKEKVWHVQTSSQWRTVSWLLTATGVVSRPGPIPSSNRIFSNPIQSIRSVYERPVKNERVAILGGGDNAFEYATTVLDKGGCPTVFLRAARAQSKFTNLISPDRLRPVARSIEDRFDGVWIDGERFDSCFFFYGFEAFPIPLEVDGSLLDLSPDGRYPLPYDVNRRLPWRAIGDARAGSPWTVDDAVSSANAAVACIAVSLGSSRTQR